MSDAPRAIDIGGVFPRVPAPRGPARAARRRGPGRGVEAAGPARRRRARHGRRARDRAGHRTGGRESCRDAAAITLKKRPFDVSDLDGVWYVVAAATPDVNRAVAQAAEERQLFVNAVDDPPNATAYLGGVLRRGGVTVAISTDGHAPRLPACFAKASMRCCRTNSTNGSTRRAPSARSGWPMACRWKSGGRCCCRR